jgi:CspA family cold shock protein
MAAGTVKWYSSKRGYGFVVETNTGLDVFLHQSALARAGIAELKSGQPLEFTYKRNERGFIVDEITSVGMAPTRANNWGWADRHADHRAAVPTPIGASPTWSRLIETA